MNTQQARSKVGHALRDAAAQQLKTLTKRQRVESDGRESSQDGYHEDEDDSLYQPAKVQKVGDQPEQACSTPTADFVNGGLFDSCYCGDKSNDNGWNDSTKWSIDYLLHKSSSSSTTCSESDNDDFDDFLNREIRLL
jgi:hypothetical protein